LLQEFDLEIKDKKGIENFVADHLSRMQFKNPQELPINNFLWDDMLLKVIGSDPWFANIFIFMVAGYVPPGKISESSFMKLTFTYGMNRTSSEFAPMDCSGGVFRLRKQPRSLKDAIQHCMEDIMGRSALMLRSDKVDSSGQRCTMTPKNSYGGASRVRNMGISMQEMPCHSPPTSS
jgi:hypothetical protein